jgi:uncharacterized protein (DUF849 family)
MFSDNFTFGFPPEEWAVEAYVRLLGIEEPDAQWMVAGLGVQIDPLLDFAVTHGGHIRVGLEDAPLGHTVSNVEQVRAARARIERNGGTTATAAQVRERLSA